MILYIIYDPVRDGFAVSDNKDFSQTKNRFSSFTMNWELRKEFKNLFLKYGIETPHKLIKQQKLYVLTL